MNASSFFNFSTSQVRQALLVAVFAGLSVAATAQQPPANSTKAQQAAMQKLSFLAGHWSGPITIVRGPGEPLRMTQSENVQFKLDGLVLLIEGKSTGADGKVQFEALATVAFDNVSQSYHFRAYHDGNYLDTVLTVLPDGFSWGYTSGPAKIENTMHLTTKGEWQETTTVVFGDNPPRPSVEMLLTAEK